MKPKFFTIYCAVLIFMLIVANYQGMIYTHYITGQHQEAAKNANHFHK